MNWVRCRQTQLEFGPIILGVHKIERAPVESCEVARQIQAKSMTGDRRAILIATESFEKMFLRFGRDRLAVIANDQKNFTGPRSQAD